MSGRTEGGFSIVELAIALVVAGLFIVSGFQLYGVMTNAAAEARREATASNYAYKIMRSYSYSTVLQTCDNGIATNTLSANGIDLPAPVQVQLRRCHPDPSLDLLKIEVVIRYGSPAKEVRHATYVTNE